MARIDDLIEQLTDSRLREQLTAAIGELRRRQRFGLVFEQHIPETTLLPGTSVAAGQIVQYRRDPKGGLWRVLTIKKTAAVIEPAGSDGKPSLRQSVKASDLLTIRPFGDPVYPALEPLGSLRRHSARPSHIVIEGENYHALQLLLYLHEGEVDCIYIDPPYNTGARDWKYNNRLVDAKDEWRHSKWLSMMDRRLRLAKRLLRPDGVLIVTIDEHEVHHLGVLLEAVFPGHLRHMVTVVINPKGTGKLNFARVDEYAIFCVPDVGRSIILGTAKATASNSLLDVVEEQDEPQDDESETLDDADVDDEEIQEAAESVSEEPATESYPFPPSEAGMWELRHLRRRGSESGYRHQRPNQFYPIYIDPEARKVVGAGDSLPLETAPTAKPEPGLEVIWPIDKEGHHRCWRYVPETMRDLIAEGRVVLGKHNPVHHTWTLNYWVRKTSHRKLKTVWTDTIYDAGTHGTTLLHNILGKRGVFPFPKSVYAVRDSLAAVLRIRPNALIVDFFAGSGTTLHATALLNVSDGGTRRCILVTNNEVDDKSTRRLHRQGYFAGDPQFDEHGIFQQVTRPRCEAVISGKRPDGAPIPGVDKDGRKFAQGLEENVSFYRLSYLDPDSVELGSHFEAVLPLLWIAAGSRGTCPTLPKKSADFLIAEAQGLAVLLREGQFSRFRRTVVQTPALSHVFLVTDSEEAFAEMRSELPRHLNTGMLYRDYLRSFRINTERNR